MAEDLWELRKKRGLTVAQLANKSGVPAVSIHEYEHGQAVRVADLSRLAKALFVDELDIKIQSEPLSTPQEMQPPSENNAKPAQKKETSKRKPPPLATPNQIGHLLNLAGVVGENEQDVVLAAGQPLESLTRVEIKELLKSYTERVAASREAEEELRPDGTRRRRAQLPEAVDEFELTYLQERQANGEVVTFKLLTGEQLAGKVIGFSPYEITIQQQDDTEVSIHKLALVYYTCEPAQEPSA